ncbi:MAG: hypothetical protein IT168_24135 [Bryobacterales bacterium]|nr:hypothetical protein [Bryobacterales bacterium]
MAPFHKLALELMNQHILFDVKPDDIVDDKVRAAYTRVYTLADAERITNEQFTSFSYFDGRSQAREAQHGDAARHHTRPVQQERGSQRAF